MSRPRAGHGWTMIKRGEKYVHYIANDDGEWVPAGVACNWERCSRCRRPTQIAFGSNTLCNSCYYHKSLSPGEFWDRKNDKYFPYNIGHKMIHERTVVG
jgi:hypothetical protein